MCSLSRVCGLLCRPPRMCRVGALYVMPFSKLKAWLKVWCVVVQQLVLARPASVFSLSFGLHDDNLSTLDTGVCRSYEPCSTFGNYYCYPCAVDIDVVVSRWLLLLHAYKGPIRQSWAPQDSLAAHRSLHMSAEDDNYGGFGLPFAVLVVASWASINLALNFVRYPPTPNSAPLHVSDLVVPAAVQFIRVAP